MNYYTQRFFATCPRTKARVEYTLTIETHEVIFVEDLQEYTGRMESDYHEGIADSLYDRFGSNQTLTAHHHGTDIRTTRP